LIPREPPKTKNVIKQDGDLEFEEYHPPPENESLHFDAEVSEDTAELRSLDGHYLAEGDSTVLGPYRAAIVIKRLQPNVYGVSWSSPSDKLPKIGFGMRHGSHFCVRWDGASLLSLCCLLYVAHYHHHHHQSRMPRRHV